MDPGLAIDRYGTSAIVRNAREARAGRREYQAPLCSSQVLLAPVGALERRYQLLPRRVTHPCGKLTAFQRANDLLGQGDGVDVGVIVDTDAEKPLWAGHIDSRDVE